MDNPRSEWKRGHLTFQMEGKSPSVQALSLCGFQYLSVCKFHDGAVTTSRLEGSQVSILQKKVHASCILYLV